MRSESENNSAECNTQLTISSAGIFTSERTILSEYYICARKSMKEKLRPRASQTKLNSGRGGAIKYSRSLVVTKAVESHLLFRVVPSLPLLLVNWQHKQQPYSSYRATNYDKVHLRPMSIVTTCKVASGLRSILCRNRFHLGKVKMLK